ncbi:cyclic nucleotide-binding domain-containing protein [Peredibacter starrii]|uniref:Cyclic nucleotide-binding domain-containing protein n=1 Tax=Peredibacter starrii TaxID=28202 RepID=A0AAX4HMB2_9BACT|nr:cyclic nucleotide-binding domain-containing protein [Peredibacter starrii]WPU64310.1 cyclic nucleotide-binding domain-containing protein [Peredibacter starrii]
MAESLKLDQIRPVLKPCSLYEGEKNIVVEDSESKSQVVLPKENQEILELLNGKHSIKDISSALYHSQGKVSFHSIITTIKLLNEAKLLEGVGNHFEGLPEDKSPHEQKTSILNRTILELQLFKRVKVPFKNDNLFFGLVAVLFGAFANFECFTSLNLESFLKNDLGYEEAILRVFLISSLLMSMRALFQGALLLTSVGSFYGPYLRFYPYAVALGVNDNSIYSHSKKSVIVAYGVMSSLLYGVSCCLLTLIPGLKNYANDVAIVSILLTFMEMNPYRRSDLTKLFYFFYADTQLKNIMPYLKNCSLSGILNDTGAKISDEIRYVVYSVLSLGWAVGFTLFSFEVVLKSFPGLFYQIQLGQDLSKYSAVAVLASLLFITGYLLIDLFHTLVKNILSPLMVPLSKFKGSSKIYKAQDLSIDELHANLKKNMLFNQFGDDAITFLLEKASIKTMKKGDTLILQGDSSRHVYYLVRGSVNVNVREKTGRTKHIVTLGSNVVLGEMAILGQQKRSANVVAAEEIVYLELHEKIFSDLMTMDQFKQDYEKLRNRIEISQFVSSANMFKDFPPEIMNLFVEAGDLVIFPKGHSVVDQGENDKTFYLLIRGKVEIVKDDKTIAELGQGDFFGEVALIANVPRTATVNTLEESLFLYIEDKKFWKILSENIELAMYIESVGRHRMVEAKAA